MKPTTIYVCCDPDTNEVRYVGKTEQPLYARIKNHAFNKANNHAGKWFRKVKEPIYFCVETVPPGGDWVEAEQFWIAYMKALGARLVNSTIGGEGGCGYKHSPEFVQRLVSMKTGLRHTEESKKKMSLVKTGKKLTPEHKAKISASGKGTTRPPHVGELTRVRHLGAKRSEETKRRISEVQRGKKRTAEAKAKTSATLRVTWALRKQKALELAGQLDLLPVHMPTT